MLTTTVVGLITDNDVTAYREVVKILVVSCQSLPKELIMDNGKKKRAEHAPIHIDGAVMERVKCFKFFSVHITNKLTWSKHTKTVVTRARQHLFPLRRLKRFGMDPQILKSYAAAPSRAP